MTLFPTVSNDQFLLELMEYEKHIRGQYEFTLHIEPMPTPRPRSKVMLSRSGQPCAPWVLIYHDKDYTDYKEVIKWLLKDARLGLKRGDYSMLLATMYLPYPKSTPKKNLIEGSKHRKKPDYDNFIKGFQDALEQAGIIKGDGQLADGAIRKRYTIQQNGFIAFNLVE
jgi:Holliday junction resolvase RusA-like endonuclease